MPSPFPGIDPYIESQGYWPDFHARFIPYCSDALNEVLPDHYEARLGEQLRLVEIENPLSRTVLPDVAVQATGHGRRQSAETEGGVGTLATVTIDLPADEVEEVRDLWIEIRRRPDRNLVTAIEILSPTNKSGSGYWEYRAKRRHLIRQRVHLVELDFLVGGYRLEMEQDLPAADFYAFLSRANRRPKCDVYAWSIRHPLPEIPIPLLEPDPDIMLDIPGLFKLAYDRGRYARSLDYTKPLDLPLARDDRVWAEDRARRSRS
jgi:hypothetical protein